MTKSKPKDQEPALFESGEEQKHQETAPAKQAKKPTPTKKEPERLPEKKGEVVVMKPREPANMLGALLGAAQNPELNPTTARELFALYMETEAKQQFHDALLRVELPSINRDGQIVVQGGKLRFASFENVHKVVTPLLKREGFRLSFQPMPGPNGEGLVVECRLIRGLYEERCVVPISTSPASRAMNSQQATGAAIKYASRYGIIALLALRSEWIGDADLDGNDPAKVKAKKTKDGAVEIITADGETISAEQLKILMKEIDSCGIEPSRFMDKYKIERMDDLPAKSFNEAVKACRDYGKRKAANG